MTGRLVPDRISAPYAWTPTCTFSKVTGAAPKRLDRRRRMPPPPMLARTTIRTVCPPRAAAIWSVEVLHAPTSRVRVEASRADRREDACSREDAWSREEEREPVAEPGSGVRAAVGKFVVVVDSAWTGVVGSAAVAPLTARARAAMVNR
ncbi:hypothetical protein GCM10010116_54040 [Microbispora rosea subsp. aerata]|nr:hypothetical protein GCM10010116_54040 [Microbispora rosea subsp. aerata]